MYDREDNAEQTGARATQAEAMGEAAGRSAASWVFDGNTSDETYRAFLKGVEDGDPLIVDQFGPRSGWLSGEDSDAPTPQTLATDLGYDLSTSDDLDRDNFEADCEAYEEAAERTYWHELERIARIQIEPDED